MEEEVQTNKNVGPLQGVLRWSTWSLIMSVVSQTILWNYHVKYIHNFFWSLQG
jgi:hypothetical protein